MIYKFCFYLVKLFAKIFFPYRILGIENLKMMNNGFIICSNHISNMDAIFLHISVGKKIYLMAKSELFKYKIFGNILESFGAIPVRRGKRDINAVISSEEVVLKKEVLGIFVEGTRSKTGKFLRPKSGAAIISLNTKCPIIPVCITPSKSIKVKMLQKTNIIFGKPIYLSKMNLSCDSYEDVRKASEIIMNEIKKLRKK